MGVVRVVVAAVRCLLFRHNASFPDEKNNIALPSSSVNVGLGDLRPSLQEVKITAFVRLRYMSSEQLSVSAGVLDIGRTPPRTPLIQFVR
jgi:hypothetical protein